VTDTVRSDIMRNETSALGQTFAEWERVTADYLKGMEALRRREPGASVHMARLAREMQRCQARLTPGVYGSKAVLSHATREHEEKAQPKARRGTWTASAWDVLVKPRRFNLRGDQRLSEWR
jgi:hypothetical protein